VEYIDWEILCENLLSWSYEDGGIKMKLLAESY
jgi:hypothetical protein